VSTLNLCEFYFYDMNIDYTQHVSLNTFL